MKLFYHVLYSWLLAIAILLIGLFIYELTTMTHLPYDFFSPGLIAFLFVALLVASPSLFLGLLFLRFIHLTQYTLAEKFFLWYAGALIAVILNIAFVAFLFAPEEIEPNTFFSFWPAYVAVVLSLSIRCKYFFLINTKPVDT